MATYNFPNAKIFTGYQNANHSFAGPAKVTSITDGTTTNQQFTKGESLTITVDNNGTVITDSGWIFQGTTTAIEGGPYIVIQKSPVGTRGPTCSTPDRPPCRVNR